MKQLRLFMNLVVSAIVATLLVACGNSGSGAPPGGFVPTPGQDQPTTSSGGVITEENIRYSYFGKSNISSSSAAKAIVRDILPGQVSGEANNGGSGIFEVNEFYYNNNPHSDCDVWSFFKPTCKSKWSGYRSGLVCDPYGYNYFGGPYDCSSYNNGQGGLWFETKDNGMVRLRLMFRAEDYYYYSTYQDHFAMWTVDDIDPNDSKYVQNYNGGKGVKITLSGAAWTGSYDKIIVVEIDDLSGYPDTPPSYTDVRVRYGTASSLVTVLNTRLYLKDQL